jgi:hypothetical protein
LKEANAKEPSDAVAIVSYDEKPGMHAIGSTAPDLPPKPGVHAAFARDHEYKRHGTLSLLARIALVTGKVHAVSRIDIAPASSSSSYSSSILPIRLQPRSKLSSTTILPTLRRKPKPGSLPNQRVASNLPSPQSMAPGSISSKASSPSWCVLRHIRVASKHELAERILAAIEDINQQAVPILGLTNSKKPLDMIQSLETLY